MNHQSLTLNRDSQSEELNRLYTVVKGHIPKVVFERKNRNNSWLHGYNDQYDVVILSKTGRIGARMTAMSVSNKLIGTNTK